MDTGNARSSGWVGSFGTDLRVTDALRLNHDCLAPCLGGGAVKDDEGGVRAIRGPVRRRVEPHPLGPVAGAVIAAGCIGGACTTVPVHWRAPWTAAVVFTETCCHERQSAA